MRLFLIRFIDALLQIYYWLIIIRVIISWLPQIANIGFLRPVVRFVFDITEPFLTFFRKIIPVATFGGVGIDFSPFIAIITLIVIRSLLIRFLGG